DESLQDVLLQIINLKRNANAKALFLQATENFAPTSCSVKVGWKSGSAINFHCKFVKNGTGTALSAIENGIENANEIKHFIYGLNPKIFRFYPELAIDEIEPNCFFLSFTLLRNAQAKRKKQVR
ncbi:MAG TPA: hypothetical protein DCQ31_05640, partial [Bacteroidales bacterium]|nr:hypothetical protein [Bacteroidales bacterium]